MVEKGWKGESGLPLLMDVTRQHAPSPAARQGSQQVAVSRFLYRGELLTCGISCIEFAQNQEGWGKKFVHKQQKVAPRFGNLREIPRKTINGNLS